MGEVFGFPEFYGANMNAWLDCMSYLDDASAERSKVQCAPVRAATIKLTEAADFAGRCSAQYEALVECAAFVNWRRLEQHRPAVLALTFYK